MSKALRCDHCMEFFDPMENADFTTERIHISNLEIMDIISTKNNQFSKLITNLDFCPKCSDQLQKWFNGEAKIVEEKML